MKVTLVPSSVSAATHQSCQYLTSYLLNDTVAIDAGSLGLVQGPDDQARVRHVFLTHSHLDHLASLPIFLENVYQGKRDCVTVYGTDAVLTALRQDLFNDRLWPDFVALSQGGTPFLALRELKPGQAVECEGLRVTPVPVNHVVPTVGFLVEDGSAAIGISSDTGPTEEFWELANATAHLEAVFLEATFPSALAELADVSKHLTPPLFAAEVQKLRTPATVFAVHIKPRYRDQVLAELRALDLPRVKVGQPGRQYSFGGARDGHRPAPSGWARWLRTVLPWGAGKV